MKTIDNIDTASNEQTDDATTCIQVMTVKKTFSDPENDEVTYSDDLSCKIREKIKISLVGREGFFGWDYSYYNASAKQIGAELSRTEATCLCENTLDERDVNGSLYESIREGVDENNGTIEIVNPSSLLDAGQGIIVLGGDFEDRYFEPLIKRIAIYGKKPIALILPEKMPEQNLLTNLQLWFEENDDMYLYLGAFTNYKRAVTEILYCIKVLNTLNPITSPTPS